MIDKKMESEVFTSCPCNDHSGSLPPHMELRNDYKNTRGLGEAPGPGSFSLFSFVVNN